MQLTYLDDVVGTFMYRRKEVGTKKNKLKNACY